MTDVQEFRITLTVDDFDAAVRLYRDALGLQEVADWSTDQGRVLLLDAGRATLELFDEAQAAMVDELEVGRARVGQGPLRAAGARRGCDGRHPRPGRRHVGRPLRATRPGATATPAWRRPTACS